MPLTHPDACERWRGQPESGHAVGRKDGHESTISMPSTGFLRPELLVGL